MWRYTMQYVCEDIEYNMYMKPTCTAFIKATLVYNNIQGLHIYSHSLTDFPQSNFLSCKLHSW